MQDRIKQMGETPIPLKYIIPIVIFMSGAYVTWDRVVTHDGNASLHLGTEKFYQITKERDTEIQALRDRIEKLEWTDSVQIKLNKRRHGNQEERINELKAKL